MSEIKFIKRYTKVIDKSVCKDIIDLYERLWEEETERIKQMSLCYRVDGTKSCGACDCQRLDIMQHEEFTPYVKSFMDDLQSLVYKYVDELNLHHSQWPKKHGYEHLRVKRYFADNVQQHDLHVDVTNKDSSGNRTLLADGGVFSMSVSGSGVFTDSAAEETLRSTMNASTFKNFQVIIPDFGTYQGAFMVASLEYSGEHNGEVTYSVTLESSGAITYTAD